MFEDTKNAHLTIEYTSGDEQLELDWDEIKMEFVLSLYTRLLHTLEQLRKNHALWESNGNVPPELARAWEIYGQPFYGGCYEPEKAFEVWCNDNRVPPKERTPTMQSAWIASQCTKGLKKNHTDPLALICRGMRYVRLCKLNAPGIIRRNEARYLAKELVKYCCMKNP